ncbi:hypothetical protein JQ824_10585 [Brachyspira hyodysenteriae]|uniref:Uncharacterized protein n=2 Tax=Brachyspira hyodysenteriae TaxID=159 RepID=A0A3B6VHZ0_BRAHW|nr:hypothetical protein [Brachyspira hyodysenteriae]ACN83596.1 hypothetical protein BHWA1_01116 [Brachyspira hyodysenteriae WA1]ANN64281.1 hypothetical protein BHYOB78_10485 [Brachyspira hyodysenteriae ATCC 27164]AUJ49329.1 hypothetical protein BH718_00881 [Brachyspira hyodysenteriae]KLI14014.1 hypothetical protein SU46_12155 [Brachyspira hyodysenteriae]KLI16463.1 hypothetical protein SU45_07435 [Brachyspira hyodysenteriae]
MISKQNVLYNEIEKDDYYIYINQKTNKGIFTPYYKGSCNSFLYDFKLDICRTFHKNARSYSIVDMSLDGTKIMTISVTSNDSQNNVFKIIEIGTNKVLLEINDLYVYEAFFTGNPRYIFIRAREVNIMKVFVYDVQTRKTMHTLKENIHIGSGSFNEQRIIFTYPSISENKVINYLNFNTLTETKESIGYSDIRVSKIFNASNKELLLVDNDESVSLYSGKKIFWKIQFLSFLNHYIGGFFYLKEDNKVYLDTPAIIQEKMSNNQIDAMVLYRIDAYSGNIETIQLPSKIKYKRFTHMFDYKLIDAAGNIFDLKDRTAYSFPLNTHR